MGVSFKRLSGWEPVTEYAYDAAGLLVSSRPEVEWDDTEVGWFLALQQWRDEDLCPCGCGWPKAVSMDPATEMGAVEVVRTRCHVRTALAQAQREYQRTTSSEMEGALWSTRLRSSS